MEWNRQNGQRKGYYVTNHALESSGSRYRPRPYETGPGGYGQARQWKDRRSVNGERREGRIGYDIAEGTCFMADIEFDAEGVIKKVRYDLVRPARKV